MRSKKWMAPGTAFVEDGWVVCPLQPPGVEVGPEPSMLPEFVTLHAATDDAIARYAKRWGQLHVCREHFLPLMHFRYSLGIPSPACATGDELNFPGTRTPVAVWRHWSRQARAILRLASRLQNSEPPDVADWQTIADEGLRPLREELWKIAPRGVATRGIDGRDYYALQPDYGVSLLGGTYTTIDPWRNFGEDLALRFERQNVGSAVNRWLALADVNLALNWSLREPQVELAGGALFGSLGVQLLQSVSRADALEVCSSCGNPFAARRRPRVNQRRYCDACGHAAAVRDAAKDFRRRQREKKDGKARKR